MLRPVAAPARSTTPTRARRFRRRALLAAVVFASATIVQAGTPVRSIAIPRDGGWDDAKVDAAGRRLYVAHGNRLRWSTSRPDAHYRPSRPYRRRMPSSRSRRASWR